MGSSAQALRQAELRAADITAIEWRERWLAGAGADQLPPKERDPNWNIWMLLGGRGAGKTRSLTEETGWQAYRHCGIRVHALAPTMGDVRRTMFEGPSGYLNVIPRDLYSDYGYNTSKMELRLNNGSLIAGFSATEEADRLRGPQCHTLAFDEVAAADKPVGNLETVYKVAALGCRLPFPDGVTPSRKYLATTPRPIPFLKNLAKRPDVVVTRRTTYQNLKNLSASFVNELLSMEGTTYARQELRGEFLDDEEMGIFKRSWFRLWPVGKKLPEFTYVMQSMDTAYEEEHFDRKRAEADFSACGVYGIFNTKQCFTEAELKKLDVKSKYAAVLCDLWFDRLAFPDLLDKARKTYRTKYGVPGRRPDLVLIENKSSGISLRQSLMTYGVPTWPFNPRGQSKTFRAHTASPLILQGMLFVPESAVPERKGLPRDWVEPMLEQMCAFAGPGTVQNDDLLDSCTQAMLEMSARGYFQATPQTGVHPDPDEKEERDRLVAANLRNREKANVNPYAQ